MILAHKERFPFKSKISDLAKILLFLLRPFYLFRLLSFIRADYQAYARPLNKRQTVGNGGTQSHWSLCYRVWDSRVTV